MIQAGVGCCIAAGNCLLLLEPSFQVPSCSPCGPPKVEAGEGRLYHTQARGQPPHCGNHRQYDTGLTQSFSRKTEFSTQVITVLRSSVSALGEAPSLPAEHPHGLVLPSRYISCRTAFPLQAWGQPLSSPFYQWENRGWVRLNS